MEIRYGRLEDTAGITEVHCSDVDEWHHYKNGKRTVKATYEELSILERYLHGGPWMSVESCAVHLNSLLLEGNIIAVAEIDGKIVGEAELLISEEMVNGEPHMVGHVDVIEVHRDFRKRGIGRALMEFLEKTARERGCDMLTVTPEERALPFYAKLGITEVIHRGIMVDFNLEEFPSRGVKVRSRGLEWEELRRKEMLLGRFQSSYDHWFTAFRDRTAGVDDRLYFESGKFGETLYILESSFFGGDIATVYAWGNNALEALLILGSRARKAGFKKLRTLIRERDYESVKGLKPAVLGKSVILAKRL